MAEAWMQRHPSDEPWKAEEGLALMLQDSCDLGIDTDCLSAICRVPVACSCSGDSANGGAAQRHGADGDVLGDALEGNAARRDSSQAEAKATTLPPRPNGRAHHGRTRLLAKPSLFEDRASACEHSHGRGRRISVA